MKKQIFERKIAGKTLKIQLGELADQASGCCLAQFGDTSVLATAQIGQDRPDLGFFPLTCDPAASPYTFLKQKALVIILFDTK